MRLVTDVFQYCPENVPRWNTISISGYHMREAGATAVQELAFTFANAIAYVQAAVDAGLNVDSFASRLSFFFVAQSDLLEEVAKFRGGPAHVGQDHARALRRPEAEVLDAQVPHPDRRRDADRTSSLTTTSSVPRYRRCPPSSEAPSRCT